MKSAGINERKNEKKVPDLINNDKFLIYENKDNNKTRKSLIIDKPIINNFDNEDYKKYHRKSAINFSDKKLEK